MSYIEFNGKKSTDFGLEIQNDIIFSSPERDIELIEIDGLDGDLAISKNRLKGVTKDFPCILRIPKTKTLENVTRDISNWLKSSEGWSDLFISNDPNFVYRAICYEEYDFSRVVSWYGKGVLTFRLKPIKFYKSGLDLISVQNGKVLDNIGTRPSKPRIIITGSGDITLNIGDEKLVLRAVDGGIKVDTQSMTVTDLSGTREQWSKVYSDFPKINLGKQTVSWTGNISHLQIIPRWEAVA